MASEKKDGTINKNKKDVTNVTKQIDSLFVELRKQENIFGLRLNKNDQFVTQAKADIAQLEKRSKFYGERINDKAETMAVRAIDKTINEDLVQKNDFNMKIQNTE